MRRLKNLTKEKIKAWCQKLIGVFLNPRLLLCLLIGWMITNGWSYIIFALGIFFKIGWMQALGGGYLALLWIPFTPEKIITVAIAIFLLRVFFPNDEKTLGVLRKMLRHTKETHRAAREQHIKKREAKKQQKAERQRGITKNAEY